METEPPQPGDPRQGRLRVVVAIVCAAAGLCAGALTVISLALGEISPRIAFALAVPSVLLVAGGLVAAAARDPEAARRYSFQAGFAAGRLVRRLRTCSARLTTGNRPDASLPSLPHRERLRVVARGS